MTAALVAAVIAAIALAALIATLLFWQMKRAASASDDYIGTLSDLQQLRLTYAASKVANTDMTYALNKALAERDRLQLACDTLEDQRDALLTEAFEKGDPGAVAGAVRDALKRVRPLSKQPETETEKQPDVSRA